MKEMLRTLYLLFSLTFCQSLFAQGFGNSYCQKEVGFGVFELEENKANIVKIDRDEELFEIAHFSDETQLLYRVKWLQDNCGYELKFLRVIHFGKNAKETEPFQCQVIVLIEKEKLILGQENERYIGHITFCGTVDQTSTFVFQRTKE